MEGVLLRLLPLACRAAANISACLPARRPQVCVRCEEINISGGMVRQKAKYERFLRKRSVSNPRHGAVKFRCVPAVCRVQCTACSLPACPHAAVVAGAASVQIPRCAAWGPPGCLAAASGRLCAVR